MVRPASPLNTSSPPVGPFTSRPFFVHDFIDDTISLLFKVRGSFTRPLAEVQGEILVSMPRGQGFTVPDAGPVVLIGGGVWVAPFKLLGRRLEKENIRYEAYFELPHASSRGYADWLGRVYPDSSLVGEREDLSFLEAVTASLGDPGRYSAFYVSGSQDSLVDAKRTFEGRVPVQLAVRERMACATGSCYGCAVPVWEAGERVYARACIDGPIFPAEKLAW